MTLKSILIAGVAVLPIALSACADSASEIRAKYGKSSWTAETLTTSPYDRARIHFEAGRFGLAVKHFEMAIGQDPDSVEALNGLAASFDRLQRFRLAERYYLRALNLEPENAQTLNNLGYSYLMQGRYDLALTHLKEALALDPMNPQVRDNLQQADASLELETRDFVAAALGSADFGEVAAPARTVNLKTQPEAQRATQAIAVSQHDGPETVRIKALAAAQSLWVERSSPVVQTLITRPNGELLAAMREAGLAPRIANFRNRSALASLQTRPAPWQRAPLLVAETAVARDLSGAIRQDRLDGGLSGAPKIAPEITVEILPPLEPLGALSGLQWLSASVIDADGRVKARPVAEAAVVAVDRHADSGLLGALRWLSSTFIGGTDDGGDQGDRADLPALPDDLPSSDESPAIEVCNGTGRPQMAQRLGNFFESEGLSVNRLTNAARFGHQQTVIFYRGEWAQKAQDLAAHLPVEVRLEAVPDQRSDIRIRLGGDLLNFDQRLFYARSQPSTQPTG